MSIPPILLAIALMALTRGSVGNVILAITIAEIPRVSRLVRSVVLSLREQPYVDAAVACRHAHADDHPAPHPAQHAGADAGAGDLYLRQRHDRGVDPLLHRRRHAADHSVLGQHHGRGPRAVAGQALHRVLSRRRSCRSPCSPSTCSATACAMRSIRAWPRGSDPMALLEVENLQTHFRTPDGINRAVDGVSFHVDEGETLAIVGESGCGKSVTAMSLMRLIPEPPGKIAGSIRFQGRDLLQLSEREMRAIRGNDISMIFQEPMTSLNPVLTRRPPDRRDAAAASGPRQAGGRGARHRDADAGRHPRAGAARARISASALRRHAPARDDRHGARLQSKAPDRRRADHRARRHDPGADPAT